MWDALVNFLSKINFIEGFTAIVMTFLIFFLGWLPNYDHLPFGENNHYFVGVTLFAGCILLIRLVKFIYRKRSEKSFADSQKNANFEQALRFYQELIDSLNATNLEFVVGRLNDKNEVFYTFKVTQNDHFFNSEYVRRFECIDQSVIKKHRDRGYVHVNGLDVRVVIGYQLEEELYNILMYSYEKYGKISVSGREKSLLKIKQKDQ